MAFYHAFTTARTTEPDFASLVTQLKALDPSAGPVRLTLTQWTIDKATPWTPSQIAAAQTVLDTAPAQSDQLTTQAQVDGLSLLHKAIILTILDQFNVVRARLVPPLPAITVAQMIQAIRDKAGTL